MTSPVRIPELNREKYLRIARQSGFADAITALHHELWKLENECFEGRDGWNPELFEKLKEYRAFSVELWDLRQGPPPAAR